MGRDERGAVAIEFGLLALPFFAIIFAILETSMVFFAGQVLDSAVQDASRKIRTGEAATWNLQTFKDEVCKGLYNLFKCSELRVRVTTATNFAGASTSITATSPLKPSSCVARTTPTVKIAGTSREAFTAGAGRSIQLVQVYYKWPVIVNLGGFNLQNTTDGAACLRESASSSTSRTTDAQPPRPPGQSGPSATPRHQKAQRSSSSP